MKECQKVAEDVWKFNNMRNLMFGGFVTIKFKGVANKKKLEDLGFKVTKAYPSGFEIDVGDLLEEPDFIKSIPNNTDEGNDARVMWERSLIIKEAVGETACKILKKEGIDCFLTSSPI